MVRLAFVSLWVCLLVSVPLTSGWAWRATPADTADDPREYAEREMPRILSEFFELLRLPNVASDTDNIQRNAAWIARALANRGVDAELLKLPLGDAPPIVYGRLSGSNPSHTLGVYVHYDGQPVDVSQWTGDPWEPALYDRALDNGGQPIELPELGEDIDPEWRVYARSSGDDKAPIAAWLTALDYLRSQGRVPVSNLVFFFEGEEEAGSQNLGTYLQEYGDRLDVDLWLFCDGPVHQSRRPQLVFGVRGYTGMEITEYGANRYLHSGHYGNFAPNPAMRLAQLLATMKDDQGRVIIDGFYETSAPFGEDLAVGLATLPAVDDDLRVELGLAASEENNAAYLRQMLIPSLNIRGLQSGTVGPTARNIIPPTATVSLDIRLAKGNDPAHMLDVVERHIRDQGYTIVEGDPTLEERLASPRLARVVRGKGYRAVRTSMDHPEVAWLIETARGVTGDELVLMPSLGGSLPIYLFEDAQDAPLVVVPIANHDNNQHAPDENLRLANLLYGVELFTAILTAP